jgi:preprotein translocase subunit SecF
MARQSDDPTQTDRDETVSPELARLLLTGIVVAMLIGVVCDVVWMAYHLWYRYFGA